MKHLALLRGINVSGHKMIKMEELRKALESIGFTNVSTYIQSGNVFVDSDEESAAKVGFLIKQEIYKTFGHDVPVIMVTKDDLQACLERNEFLNESDVDLKKLYVSFISSELPENMITQLNLNFIEPDKIQLDGRRIYLKYDISPAKTKLDNKWIEKSMNVVSTTRNWNTVNKLLELFGD
ncbi:DUF1697 domain-containing protein [Flavobacterium capsici]|uniref:DUF1697 domain-containing protein n=1 Tax=Flavobacterium capsici TaxID=3075618 RepID=A0AA96F617_9FLAO|nr:MULTISPECIES: DUF1697 domain-containing protein [unclassified Flavobacterium]WNM18138.1 DUF1697 domain-containing protein [Flavobacterium sp. PMR2A8]WNM22190.1 DUF1697 domain-containing protein [Flavobacterium sp. PMTSA4]